MVNTKIFGFLMGASLFAQNLWADPEKFADSSYRVELGAHYIDGLKRTQLPGNPGEAYHPRTLGLTQAKIDLFWQTENSVLQLGLRPDCPGTYCQKFDSRAGTVYREHPAGRLLDEYLLSYTPHKDVSFSWGVWGSLLSPKFLFPDDLEFGLNVILPESFSGVSVDWRKTGLQSILDLNAPTTSFFAVTFYVIAGHGDRVTSLGYRSDTYDTAPAMYDPYMGGAIHLALSLHPQENADFIVGSGQKKTSEGKADENYLVLRAQTWVDVVGKTLLTGAEYKIANDRFIGFEPRPALTQQSAAIKAKALNFGGFAALGSVAWGASERHSEFKEKQVYRGHSYQLGLERILNVNFVYRLILNEERRVASNAGSRGGFKNNGNSRALVRRMSFAIDYELGGTR